MRRDGSLFARYQCGQRDPTAAGASLLARRIGAAFVAGDFIGDGWRDALRSGEASAGYTDILPWSDAITPHYGTLRAALEGSGGGLRGKGGGITIAPLDLMIAAHALAIDATLVSADQALSMIDILKVEDWSV
jgi:predicted nucleic acid-binding protein